MLLAVASHAVLAVVELDDRWRISRLEILATGLHYGIALPPSDDRRFITMVRQDDVVATYARDEATDRYREIDRFVCEGDFDDIHQVAWQGGGLLVANTGRNSVEFVPLGAGARLRHAFGGVQHDVHHVNSVYPCGTDQVLVMLNNRNTKPSEVAVLARDADEGFRVTATVPLPDNECHCVFADEEVLAYNASKRGDFVVLDVRTRQELRRIHFDGYAKGLSVTRDWFLVGFSDVAVRDDRSTSRGHLGIVDRGTLELVASVDLNTEAHPPGIGNVNEVRCLSEPDLGHARSERIVIP